MWAAHVSRLVSCVFTKHAVGTVDGSVAMVAAAHAVNVITGGLVGGCPVAAFGIHAEIGLLSVTVGVVALRRDRAHETF